MDINKVIVIGRLTQTCGETQTSFGYLQNGTCKANVTIAVNRNRKNGDEWIQETSYFDVTIWGKTAENLKPYLTKGKQIAVEGYLKQDRWEKDGQKFSRIVVIAENVQLLGGNNQTNNGQEENYNHKQVTSQQQYYEKGAVQSSGYGYQVSVEGGFKEDIPF